MHRDDQEIRKRISGRIKSIINIPVSFLPKVHIPIYSQFSLKSQVELDNLANFRFDQVGKLVGFIIFITTMRPPYIF